MLRCGMKRRVCSMSNKTDPIISPDLLGPTKNPASFVHAVVQTNVRATEELLRAENPKAVLELQRRFVREYTTALLQGAMTIVDTIEATANRRKFTDWQKKNEQDPLIITLEA